MKHLGSYRFCTMGITTGCTPGCVSIYDSLYSNRSAHVQESLACLTKHPETNLLLNFQDVHKQSGASDCGVFSIAHATALCLGVQPRKVVFNQSRMREHLRDGLPAQHFNIITVNRQRRARSVKTVPVYCICRMPHMGLPMVECSKCKEWHHGGVCIVIPQDAWSPNCKWLCPSCA